MLIPLILALGGLVLGSAVGYFVRATIVKNQTNSAEARAVRILEEAKDKEQKIIIEGKEKAIGFIEEGKKELQEKEKDIRATQERLTERERLFDKTLLDFETRKAQLDDYKSKLETAKAKIDEVRAAADTKLEEVAGMGKEAALQVIMDRVEVEQQDSLMSLIRKYDQHSEEELENHARKILSLVIQRFASSQVVDAATTFVQLTSEDMKGRIIGKEGRNIKAIEHLTGCELIVDDTPGMITISGFSPVRRQVAKRALEILMKDGRIQPAKIEDAVKESKNDLAKEMRKAGEDALYELGIPVSSIDPKLVSILGRLKYRTSYGQNVLQHSIEVARISGMIGEELGMDPFPLKKGGLFHDIGKAVDHDMQGAHPQIGYNIMKKFGFPEEMAYQSIAHHEDRPRTIEGVVVKAADAISGARPGARRNSVEEYLQRLQNLEMTAAGFPGVEKAYAIQAGREVRVFVEPTEIDDFKAYELARDIAKKIEAELTYPGEVKVTVIRETRVIEFAR
ncbi:MAG: ribonuclease Y [Patescibacteria group bacterium]|jgi:ribonuclease Y